jgi:hypothetical protein
MRAHTPNVKFTERGKATGTKKTNGLLVRAAARYRAGVGMPGRPVFRRKRHAPECGAWHGKLQAYFGLATAHRTEENNMTLLFLFGLDVAQLDDAPARDPSGKQHQCAVCVDGESFRKFLEVLALSVHPSKAKGDLHQHALAAAPRPRIRRCDRTLSHTTSLP